MRNILKLLRWPNLLIIILSQVLLRYYIIKPLLNNSGVELPLEFINFLLLVFSFLLMAAAGYLINDYYDIETDRINKPDKALIGRDVSTISVRIVYIVLNVLAIGIGFYLAFEVSYFKLGFVFVAIVFMLWYYSARYKRMVFWGNLVVSVLIGITIFMVWIFEFFALRSNSFDFISAYTDIRMIQYLVWGVTFFAFLTTLIREMIKDVEDLEGDQRCGFNTMPVAIGKGYSKIIILVFIITTIILLALAQYWLLIKGFSYTFWYLCFTVQLLLFYTLVIMFKVKDNKDWKYPGNLMKVVMVAGIIGMQFIYFDLQ